MISFFNSKFLIPLCLFFLYSCSYQLLNSYDEIFNISISSEDTELNNLFLKFLKENEAYQLNNFSEKEDVIKIKIEDHQISKFSGAASLDGRTSKVRIQYLLKFSISTSRVKTPIQQEIKESSYYIYDDSNLLSMEEEENLVVQEFIKSSQQKLRILLLSLREDENI